MWMIVVRFFGIFGDLPHYRVFPFGNDFSVDKNVPHRRKHSFFLLKTFVKLSLTSKMEPFAKILYN